MRPLRVELSAFGSYGQQQIVDLRRLGEHRFFLVCGATGVGKTTLFDAICFALYGVSSGGEREPAQLRSDLASPDLPTEVTFDFALAEHSYRVRRSPRQQRPKRRGSGMTEVEPRAALWCRDEVQQEEDDGAPLACQWRAVTEAVEQLLGFRADQFRQVVMLPQGRFERLLKADSKDRQRLLNALFDTAVYGQIEQALKRAAKVARGRAEQLHVRQTTILGEAEVSSESELVTRCEQLVPQIAAGEQQLGALEQLQAEAEAQLAEARRVIEIHDELADARKELTAVLGEEPQQQRRRQLLAQARQAAPLKERARALQEREREREAAEEQLAAAAARRDTAQRAAEEAAAELAARDGEEEQRRGLDRELQRMREMAEKVAALAATREQVERQERELAAQAGAWREQREALAELLARQRKSEERHRGAERDARELEPRRLAWEAAEKQREQRLELEQQRARLEQREQAHRELGERRAALERTEERRRRTLRELERRWLAGQAAALAARLQRGEPCPVCGAREHPAPAAADGQLPAEEQLEQQRQQLRELEQQRQQLQTEIERQHAELVGTRARVETLVDVLGLWSRQELDVFAERAAEHERVYRQALRQEQRLDELAAELAELGEERAAAEQRLATAERGRDELRRRLERERALLEERERDVPPYLRRPEALTAAIEQAAEQQRELERRLEQARARHQRCEAQLAAADEHLRGCERALRRAAEHASAQQAQLREQRVAAGFASADELRQALLDEDELAKLEAQLQAYERRAGAAQQRFEGASEAAQGLELRDVERLREATEQARAARDGALEQLATLRQRLQQDEGRLERLRQTRRELEAADQRFALVGRLSDLANGRNPQRITFQRFILASLLEDVLIAASERLRRMTRGRFVLARSAEARGGLDLEITDNATGTVRAPVTLSGGEAFLASLSLALGLADVVQAHSGGVRLDTIFIDEGFGGLDPEALDQALAALLELQRAGKQVGIISHVPELRERIDARLEISYGPHGSEARLVVP